MPPLKSCERRAPSSPSSGSSTRSVSPVELDCQILKAENQTERLVVFTAAPGSEDAERLRLLSVVRSQSFAT